MAVKKTQKKTKSARLNLLIHPELKRWAHRYAEDRGKSISGLIMDHLVELREQERGGDVEQI
jgi:hypothetical protein